MKKLLKITLGCAMVALFVALTANSTIYAKFSAKTVDKDTVYKKYDLDGDGKKDKIKYTVDKKNGYVSYVGVYINNKVVISEYLSEKTYWEDCEVQIYDFNPSDKYKEVVLNFYEEFEQDYKAYRYENKLCTLLFDTGSLFSGEDLVAVQKKGNKVLRYDSTMCIIGNCFYVTKNYKIKKQKLVEVKPKDLIYDIPLEKWGDYVLSHTLSKDIKVYKNADGTNVVTTLEKGTEIRLTKFKFNEEGEPVFAMIEVIGGEKNVGWIEVKYDFEKDNIVEQPMFAG